MVLFENTIANYWKLKIIFGSAEVEQNLIYLAE